MGQETSKANIELRRIIQNFYNMEPCSSEMLEFETSLDEPNNFNYRSPEKLNKRAKDRIICETIKQENNLEKILFITANELKSSKKATDRPVGEDWLVRFFQIAKNVCIPKMQNLFGKAFANEIEAPGSFSLRTFEKMRDMSMDEIELFQKILPLVLIYDGCLFITSNDDVLKKYGVSYSDIIILDDCGLLFLSSQICLNLKISKENSKIVNNPDRAILIKGSTSEEKDFVINIHDFTKAGYDLCNLLYNSSDNDFIFDFAEIIFKYNDYIEPIITIHKIKNGEIDYAKTIKKFISNEG